MRKATTLKNYGDKRTVVGDPPANVKAKAKKDTKRWCGGRVGRKHDPEWKPSYDVSCPPNTPQIVAMNKEREARDKELLAKGHPVWQLRMEIAVCRRCGRHLGWRDKKATS